MDPLILLSLITFLSAIIGFFVIYLIHIFSNRPPVMTIDDTQKVISEERIWDYFFGIWDYFFGIFVGVVIGFDCTMILRG